jgi:hypothetical protein
MTTLEAIVWLVLARVLVGGIRFGRWRRWLGRPVAPPGFEPEATPQGNLRARRLARVVERAAARLPGESRCLPQAMALHWLLRRRGLGGVLVMGVKPGAGRGGLDDLHCWVVRDGEVLIGAGDLPYQALYAAAIDARLPPGNA